MNPNLLMCVVALALAVAVTGPAYAQQYFNCEYAPRCEAVQNKQCEPSRTLKDKITLIRLHSSAEDVERTWAVLAKFEPEFCGRLGDRGNIIREFMSFRAKAESKAAAKADPMPSGASCADPLACAEVFVGVMRERWQRDDLDARIKVDLERNAPAATKSAQPAPAEPTTAAATEPIPADSWQTTTRVAAPAKAPPAPTKAAGPAKVAAPAKLASPGKTRTVQSQ